MQTFLPYADFDQSASVLDYRRLGKQRVETWQVIRALQGLTKGWRNHPCTLMWQGYVPALAAYGEAMCFEWKRRGYKDTMSERFMEILSDANYNYDIPAWLGNEQLHISHQSNLIRKDPAHYAPIFPGVPDDLPYLWLRP